MGWVAPGYHIAGFQPFDFAQFKMKKMFALEMFMCNCLGRCADEVQGLS
jgi:hypothetical protein